MAMKLMASGVAILRGDDQITLILPVFIIDQYVHAAIARFFDNLFNGDERRAVIIGKEIALQLAQRFCRGVPVRCFKIAQRIGVAAPAARASPERERPPVCDEGAEFFDQLRAHGRVISHCNVNVKSKNHTDVILSRHYILHPRQVTSEDVNLGY